MLLKLDYLCRKNRTMFLKILILDVHRQKNFGNLKGSTPKEQYDYYEKKYLNNATYVKSLLQEYPELKRLLELKNNSIQRAECEIRKSLYAEKEQIQKIFCDGRKFSGTVGIYMSKGDIHRGGRSVAKVELDNGTILYYKPHSLDKNIKYQELYNYLCRKTGISCRTVQYLSHDSYGWEEKIENIPCKNESEVEHYYFRMGIHLFLGYALGATDLHGENIIAHGEYPVIIDMETYPGYLKQQSEKDGSSVEEKINKSTEIKLANSVIHTGMLPVLTWGRGNRGVLISAMGTEEKIKTPFKLPVVKDDKTSDIHIEYEPVEMQIKECIVRLNDQVINAADYTECIIRGFCRAYMVAMADKKVEVMLSGFFDGRSRVVLRHTQQYAMYLMASFHPDYMKSRECRKALLNVIHKEGESSFMKEIHDYEIDSLLEMDIPCSEIDANSRSVYDGNGGEHKEYLPCTPYESWRMHMKQMSYSDMECQCDYIRLSMEMLKASDGKKKMFPTRIKGYDTDKERKIYSQIRKIVHRICSRAIIREQSAGWAGLQFWDNGHWNLRSGGIYLYDGISGIVLFLAKYLHDFEEKNAKAKARHEQILKSLNYEYDLTELEKAWLEGIEYLKQFHFVDSEHEVNNLLKDGKSVLCEGAQGTMLDIDFGSYPFVTSSNTVCAGACTGLGVAPNRIGEVYGIFKAYCTRVGAGPFPSELFDETGDKMCTLGHEFGSVTGRKRRCGWIDLVALKYSVMINGVTKLIMMKSDVLDTFETIKACVAYKVNGEEIDYFPYDITEGVEPVYAELPGWQTDMTKMQSEDEFPEEFNAYLTFLEEQLGVEIKIVSVGPDRAQTIERYTEE